MTSRCNKIDAVRLYGLYRLNLLLLKGQRCVYTVHDILEVLYYSLLIISYSENTIGLVFSSFYFNDPCNLYFLDCWRILVSCWLWLEQCSEQFVRVSSKPSWKNTWQSSVSPSHRSEFHFLVREELIIPHYPSLSLTIPHYPSFYSNFLLLISLEPDLKYEMRMRKLEFESHNHFLY